MPFKSEKQKRWMWANKPEMADKWSKYRGGGLVDNIPALLTENEYVIKADSAQKIGYDNLDRINETGELPRIKDARNRRNNK
jgi:hypothetical protein